MPSVVVALMMALALAEVVRPENLVAIVVAASTAVRMGKLFISLYLLMDLKYSKSYAIERKRFHLLVSSSPKSSGRKLGPRFIIPMCSYIFNGTSLAIHTTSPTVRAR